MRNLLTALATTGLTATLIAGCNSGNGRNFGAPTVVGTGTPGVLSSSLPVVMRDMTGYNFGTTVVNPVSGGFVNAITLAASTSGALIAASEPVHELDLVTNGSSSTTLGALPFRTTSLATLASSSGSLMVFAGQGDTLTSGNGDIYSVNGAPVRVLDTNANEAYVALASNTVLALTGGEGQTGAASDLVGASLAFPGSVSFANAIPMCAVDFLGTVFVGATGNDVGGGQARLFRLVDVVAQEIPMPFASVTPGQRQEVVGMGLINGTSAGTLQVTSVPLLAIAIGNFDRVTRQGFSGQIVLTDGTQFETLATFVNEAPTCLAITDNTIYVGTSSGRLVSRVNGGLWLDEPNLPLTQSVQALYVRDTKTLAIGVQTAAGAQLVVRTGLGNGMMIPPPVANPFFVPQIASILQARCTGCHVNVPTYMLTAAANTPSDFNLTVARVTLANPAQSPLLLKATGQVAHGGGMSLPVNSPDYNTILTWIQQGAPFQAMTPPPPPPPVGGGPFFLTAVSSILATSCTGCHVNVPTYTLTAQANTLNDYTTTIGKINLANPAQSGLILKATMQVPHSGGTVLQPNSPQVQTLLAWITAGAPFQAPPVTPKFIPDVAAVLAANCTGCHVNVPTYTLTLQANTLNDFNLTVARVTLANPAQSPLLLKATGQVTHGGMTALPIGSPGYNTILNWIAGGAPMQ